MIAYGIIASWIALAIGSFLNVAIHRLPRILQQRWLQEARAILGLEPAEPQATYHLAWPPSHCPQCSRRLRWWHNVPIVSYCLQRGRCAWCHQPIGWHYPAVELAALAAYWWTWWIWGSTPQAWSAYGLLCALWVLSVIDWRTQLLPDELTLPLMWSGLILNSLWHVWCSGTEAVMGAATGYMILWSVYWLFWLCTRKEGMGYGDFKLLAALGAWLGAAWVPWVLWMAACGGSIVGLGLMVWRQWGRNDPMPFGPFLALGGTLVLWSTSWITPHLQRLGFM